MATPETPVMVITGAAGNLGSRLRAHLESGSNYALRLLDIAPRGDAHIQAADLARYSPDWVQALHGADILIHLVANPGMHAGWPDLVAPNIDAVLNVYRAVAETGIRRVILASSVWAMAARKDDAVPIGTPIANPGNHPYGASKLFAERLAAAYADSHGIATLALRLGGCPPGANRPPMQDRWANECWLSTPDFLHGMDCALRTDLPGFHVVNLTSANPSGRWSLTEARELIGYVPADVYRPPDVATPAPLSRRVIRRLRRIFLPSS